MRGWYTLKTSNEFLFRPFSTRKSSHTITCKMCKIHQKVCKIHRKTHREMWKIHSSTILPTQRFKNQSSIKEEFICNIDKVGCIFPMVISSEFRMRQHRDDDHRDDAPHFIIFMISKSRLAGLKYRMSDSGLIILYDFSEA